jgi:hypothetical protein
LKEVQEDYYALCITPSQSSDNRHYVIIVKIKINIFNYFSIFCGLSYRIVSPKSKEVKKWNFRFAQIAQEFK